MAPFFFCRTGWPVTTAGRNKLEGSVRVHLHLLPKNRSPTSRLDATVPGGNNQFMHVIWIDGDVGSATLSDAGDQRGVALTFVDGGTATVRFGSTGLGGSLQLTRGGASTNVTLAAGVDTLAP